MASFLLGRDAHEVAALVEAATSAQAIRQIPLNAFLVMVCRERRGWGGIPRNKCNRSTNGLACHGGESRKRCVNTGQSRKLEICHPALWDLVPLAANPDHRQCRRGLRLVGLSGRQRKCEVHRRAATTAYEVCNVPRTPSNTLEFRPVREN